MSGPLNSELSTTTRVTGVPAGMRGEHLGGEVGDRGRARVGLRGRGAGERRVAAADEDDLTGRGAGDDRRLQGVGGVEGGERGGGGEQLRRRGGRGGVGGVEVEQDVLGRDVDDLGGDAGAEAGRREQRGQLAAEGGLVGSGRVARQRGEHGHGVAEVGQLRLGDGDGAAAAVRTAAGEQHAERR